MCIAPVIAARVFGDRGVRLTIGDDAGTAQACEAMGAKHVVCRHDEACVDETLKIVTTPAYMKARDIAECCASARALVEKLEKNFQILKISGGGIPFSGGEPTMQGEFVYECMKLLKIFA